MEFIGNFNSYDDVVITHPEKENPFKFEAFYFRNGRLMGFCSMDSPNSTNTVYEAMRNNIIITPDLIRKYGLDIHGIRKQIEGLKFYNNFIDDSEIKC